MKIRLFLNQSASDIIYMMRAIRVMDALSQLSFILMIAIWIQSASILTKAFTGLLLNTYFRSDFGPIVSTLEDVYENRGLSLVSDEGMQSTWIKRSNIGQDKITVLVDFLKILACKLCSVSIYSIQSMKRFQTNKQDHQIQFS